MTPPPQVRVARVYDRPGADDGVRVLVDRLWPRGLARGSAPVDEWCQQVAPSAQLRRWYGHDPQRLAEFRARYQLELDDDERRATLDHLRELAQPGPLTLLTATKAVDLSHAAVLAALLRAG